MANVLSCVNLKGGVGKTAIAVNFAAYCGSQGLTTLLIDLDPQTNATFSCIEVDGWEDHARHHGTVADLLGVRRHANAEGQERTPYDVIIPGVFENVDLVPSHLDLFTIDLDIGGTTARETRLRRALHEKLGEYDVVVCDCPPNLTIPTQNALALSTHYVVPISPDYLSAIGVALLLDRVRSFSEELEHEIELLGIIISRVGRPATHREETVNALRVRFGERVLTPELRERVAVSQAAARKVPVFSEGDLQATNEFEAMSLELLRRLEINT